MVIINKQIIDGRFLLKVDIDGVIHRLGLEYADKDKTDLELEQLAIEKYNSIKADEARREYEGLNPSYYVLRAKEYPDFREYLDAKVKQASTDLTVKQQGIEQEQKYLTDCLAVKAKYPKM